MFYLSELECNKFLHLFMFMFCWAKILKENISQKRNFERVLGRTSKMHSQRRKKWSLDEKLGLFFVSTLFEHFRTLNDIAVILRSFCIVRHRSLSSNAFMSFNANPNYSDENALYNSSLSLQIDKLFFF